MAEILDKPELRIYEIRKRQHRKMVVTIALLSLIIAAILLGGIYYTISNKKYTSYKVIHSMDKNDTSSAKYYTYQNGYIRMSRDGIMAVDKEGHQIWNDTYQMKDPQLAIKGDYACVSDRGSKLLQIYGPKGEEASIQTDNPIIKSVIASQGVTAVLVSGNGKDYITYYSKEGTRLLERGTYEKNDGFPVDICISGDGDKLVTSYVNFSKGETSSKVTFLNFSSTGKNYIDNIVGATDFGKTLVADIEFINNNTLCAFGDDKFSVYSMERTPDLLFTKELKNQVKTVFYNENYIGFVLKDLESAGGNQIVVYDLKGKIVFDKTSDFDYSSISLNNKEITLTSARDWLIYKLNGRVKLNCHFDQEIAEVLPMADRNKYIIINDKTIDEVKLK